MGKHKYETNSHFAISSLQKVIENFASSSKLLTSSNKLERGVTSAGGILTPFAGGVYTRWILAVGSFLEV